MQAPNQLRASEDRPVGPGSISLTQVEMYIILKLRREDPSRHLSDYRDSLMHHTGTRVLRETINQLLLRGFPFKGSLVKPDLVPLDKFKPENEI